MNECASCADYGRAWARRVGSFVAAMLFAFASPAPAQDAGRVHLTDLSGAIGVASNRQFTRALAQAKSENSAALIVQLDTPGGLVTSTRDLIREIIASPVPIVIYVAPSGARAASAGTFVVYASHVAAMAPGTNLGAATPINLGEMPGVPRRNESSKDEKGPSGAPQQSAAERKAINDVIALLRSLAQLRGRDVDFAEKAVREAATLTADDALKAGVIEVVAVSVNDLLVKLDGRKVVADGIERTLATKGATVVAVEADLRTRLLSIVSNPNIAFILLMIGFYGIILEFWSPGSFAPGVIGAICLILGLIGLSALPINFGALGLLLLGIGLMIAEAFTPGIGVLGIGGVAAFIAGAYFLIEEAGTDIDISISLPLIVGMAATTGLLTFVVVAAAMKSRQRPPMSGAEQMIGSRAQVVAWDGERGSIRVHGEIWNARGSAPLQSGDGVRVIGRDGLTLIVER